MKYLFLVIIINLCTVLVSPAQNSLAGSCQVTGYFFHPTSPRAINLQKQITEISTNKYQVELGDAGSLNLLFQFDLDNNNQLVNWVAVGATPALPASNFMLLDNPGNFTFTAPSLPGGSDYNIANYSNRYDPVTRILYMHYGYDGAATNENGFSRQVYEKWVLPPPIPTITSFFPPSGGPLSNIRIVGTNFMQAPVRVGFGGVVADSIIIESDTSMIARVSYGNTGEITVSNVTGVSSISGFTFIPNPPITDTQWRYVGNAGFSSIPDKASFANMSLGPDNVPYVVYVDSASGKAMVMKYNGNAWVNVGDPVSDGKCSNTDIVVDNNNIPVISYVDSLYPRAITVKTFNGTNWINVGVPGVARWTDYFAPAIAVDALNSIYLTSCDTFIVNNQYRTLLSVYKFNGTNWQVLGTAGFATIYVGSVGIALDKTTNNPYVVYSNADSMINLPLGQAAVMKYNGSSWSYIGSPNPTSIYSAFYTDIKIDENGVPYISMQEDDGFERLSVYKFSGGSWNALGSPKFSNGRTFYSSLAVDTSNNPVVAYRDQAIDQRGSVIAWNDLTGWKNFGVRGFAPGNAYGMNSLAIGSNNIPIISFADNLNGGRISVMMYTPGRLLNDSLCAGGNTSFAADNNNIGNTYRWQVDNGSGYTNITNNSIYSGVTASILNLQSVPSSYNGYSYRCITLNNGNSDTGYVHIIHFSNKWTGAVSDDWENAANWSCNVIPDANTDVIISSGVVTISSNATVHTLYTGIGVSITVSSGFNLTVLH